MYNTFLEYYRESCEKYIPKKSSLKRINKPWMNPILKSKIREKKSTWSAFKASGWSEEKENIYKSAKSNCEISINQTIKHFETNLACISKSQPKLVYQYMNSKRQISSSIKAILDHNNIPESDPQKLQIT